MWPILHHFKHSFVFLINLFITSLLRNWHSDITVRSIIVIEQNYIHPFKAFYLYLLLSNTEYNFKVLLLFICMLTFMWSILFVSCFFLFATCSSYPQLMTANTHMVRLLWFCHDVCLPFPYPFSDQIFPDLFFF